MNDKKVGVAAETTIMQDAVISALLQEAIPCVNLKLDEKTVFLRRLKEVSCIIIVCESRDFLRRIVNIVHSFMVEEVKLICFGAKGLSESAAGYRAGIEFIPYRSLVDQGEKKKLCQEIRRLMMGVPLPEEVCMNASKGNESTHFVVIGASAGGPGTVLSVLSKLPAETCGILLVQHLSRGFSSQFSVFLNQRCEMTVVEARSGDRVKNGTVYVAPDEMHMTVRRSGGGFTIQCEPGPRVNGVCPSVDCLMKSAASAAGKNSMGIILTGMGADGAGGLLAMRNAGAYTVAQDQKTSVIYGMPREAFLLGGAVKQLPAEAMAAEIQNFCLAMKK